MRATEDACWLYRHAVPERGHMPACSGRLVRVHLIPRQVLKRKGGTSLVMDPRTWVWACGGPMGVSGHHGMLDYARSLRIPRARIPADLEELAVEIGLGWWLAREYGEIDNENEGERDG